MVVSVYFGNRPSAAAAGIAFACCAMLVLTGCGDEKKKAEKTPAGQVIARIAGEEVTIHELNTERRYVNVPANIKDEDLSRGLMEALVDRKILDKRAIDAGLDRQPNVLLELRRAREQVLAQAYLQQQAATRTPVAKRDVEKFVAENPRMFADQRLLYFDQVITSGASITPELVKSLDQAKNLNEVEAILDQNSVKHFRRVDSSSTAILPPEFVTQIKQAKPTDVLLMRSGEAAYFSVLLSERPQPLTGDDALEVARRTLQARKNQADLAEIRQAARQGIEVTYLGDYANIMAAKTPPENAAVPAADAAAKTDATAAPK
jgi:peptidyl-prolyl cis-trans isomerase C